MSEITIGNQTQIQRIKKNGRLLSESYILQSLVTFASLGMVSITDSHEENN